MTHGTIREASLASGIPVRTLKRWLSQENFRQALTEVEREVFSEIKRHLLQDSKLAVLQLERILAEGDMRLRLRAAELILSKLLQMREAVDLEERLRRLEEMVEELEAR